MRVARGGEETVYNTGFHVKRMKTISQNAVFHVKLACLARENLPHSLFHAREILAIFGVPRKELLSQEKSDATKYGLSRRPLPYNNAFALISLASERSEHALCVQSAGSRNSPERDEAKRYSSADGKVNPLQYHKQLEAYRECS